MRTLVTGAAGFAGRHMLRELARHGHEPYALDAHITENDPPAAAAVFENDIRDRAALERIVAQVQPEACIHLGALAFVPSGDVQPETMLSVNVGGTLTLLETLLRITPSCRTLVISSGQIYAPENGLIPETRPSAPANLYAVSKAAADLTALGFARRYGLPVMTARPNNHTGPGQSTRFVTPAMVEQVRAVMKREAPPVLHCGNLRSRRIFSDVRDVAVAYRLLIEQGEPGQPYNVSGAENVVLSDLLDRLCAMADIRPARQTDESKFRPEDYSPELDTAKIRERTGWSPRIPLDQTLRDMLFPENEP
jgi:GDP-4-dehydro-6-deoxy-D-mannose reductase